MAADVSAVSAKEKFDAAVQVIQSLPKNGSFQPSHAMMLKFYGLYKQATNGQCNISKPAFWDVVGKAKWEAWNRLGSMRREQAMLYYVDELKKIIETMPHTENVQEFVEKLGDFYELVDDESPGPLPALIKNASPKNKNRKQLLQSNGGLPQTNGGTSHDLPRVNGQNGSPNGGLNGINSDSSLSANLGISLRLAGGGSVSSAEHSSLSSPSSDSISSDSSPNDDHPSVLSDSLLSIPPGEVSNQSIDHSHQHAPSFRFDSTVSSTSPSSIDSSYSASHGHEESRIGNNSLGHIDDSLDRRRNGRIFDDDDDNDEGEDDDDDDGVRRKNSTFNSSTGDGSRRDIEPREEEEEEEDEEEEFCDTSDISQSPLLDSLNHQSEHQMSSTISVITNTMSRHDHSRSIDSRLDTTDHSDDVSLIRHSQASTVPGVSHAVVERGGGETQGAPGAGAGRRTAGGATGSSGDGAVDQGRSRSGSAGQRLMAGGAGSGGDAPGSGHHRPLFRGTVGEQVAVALVRLQQDMDSVLTRLQTLETLSLAQHQIVFSRSRQNSGSSYRAPWWRPFARMNGSTVVFLLLWPFIVQFIMRYISTRHRRIRR